MEGARPVPLHLRCQMYQMEVPRNDNENVTIQEVRRSWKSSPTPIA